MTGSAAPTRFAPTWESLQRYRVPPWYEDVKFGIFVHWGVYAVPAFGNEWYPRNMYQQGSPEFAHHVATYGPHTQFGYKDFIPRFTADKFDPQAWARLFKAAGADYVIPVAEHHDGFAMYDCSRSPWTATKLGPRRDVIGELAAAVRQHDMMFGLSSHRAEHWWFFEGGREFASDVQDERYSSLYGPAQPQATQPDAPFLDDWLARTRELVELYQPEIIYFDWWIEQPAFAPYLQQFAAYYYNQAAERQRGVVINYKEAGFPEGAAVYDVERGQLAGIRALPWQTDTSISKSSWCHIQDQDYKTAQSIIGDLIDIVSKNGRLLLNVGPRADGTIANQEVAILHEIGGWLQINGEAIYGTRPWHTFGEGPTEVSGGKFTDTQRQAFTSQDIRFTTRADTLYAICLGQPESAVDIRSLGSGSAVAADRIAAITMLGSPDALSWSQHESGLVIQPPARLSSDHPVTFKIVLRDER